MGRTTDARTGSWERSPSQQVPYSRPKARVGEFKPAFDQLLWSTSAAGQQGLVGEFTESKPGGEGRNREHRWASESPGPSLGKLGIGYGIWRGHVDRPARRVAFQNVMPGSDAVFDVDPTPP